MEKLIAKLKLNAWSLANREQETKTMQSRKIADLLNVSEGGLEDKEKNRSSSLHKDDNQNQHVQIDSGSALQQFLDYIPITSIPGIKNSPVVQHLLQSSELEWFDNIADKNLSDFRQENPSCVYWDQTVASALDMLWQNQTCAVAVVDRQTKKLLCNVRNSDVYNLVKNNELLRNRAILTVEEFIHIETDKVETERAIEHDHGAFLTEGSLRLKNSFIPRMDLPVANKENDTLKQTMEHTTETNSSFSFLINNNEQVTGLLTLRDIILQFAPPNMNSSISGGGFFEFALEQSGCQVKNRTIIRNH